MSNTVNIVEWLCTVIHINMVNVVHRSGPENTGKFVSLVAITTSMALRLTAISRREWLSVIVALLGLLALDA